MVKPDTYVIVPTYNEADNIEELLRQIVELPANVGVIVVDDNSPDRTGNIAETWAEKYPQRIHVIHRTAKLGLGTAYVAGFNYGMDELNAAQLLTMDADFSHNPCHIPEMIAMGKVKHVVIGSRYVPGGGSRHCTWKRVLLSRAGNFVARTTLGLQAHDATAGFRLYRREVLESIPLEEIFSNGYSFLMELLFLCQRRGWQIGEVPIIFEDRRRGQTKISREEIIKAQYTVLRLFFRRLSGGEPVQPVVPVTE